MRQPLLLILALGALTCVASARAHAAPNEPMKPASANVNKLTLYIGTYTKTPQGGIYSAQFNPQNGELGAAKNVATTANPSFLATSLDGRFLYAANEWGQVAGANQGGLSAFQIDPATKALSPLNAFSMGGILCHLTVDVTGKWLFGAAYNAGTISVWPLLADGRVGERTTVVQHTGHGPNQSRQTSPHVHHIVLSPDNRRVFVADLGIDQVTIDNFDATTGQLTPAPAPFVSVAGGAGPRHIALSPSGQFLYVVSELNNTITVFKDAQGAPQQLQVVSTLPADTPTPSFAAEIAVSPDGRFVYASNRGQDSIAAYAVAPDGTLQLIDHTPVGHNPRHFTFDPTGKWLLVANQSDHSISVLSIDATSGALAPAQQLNDLPDEPVCLLFGKG